MNVSGSRFYPTREECPPPWALTGSESQRGAWSRQPLTSGKGGGQRAARSFNLVRQTSAPKATHGAAANKEPVFVSFEGIEGAGKTTLIAGLAVELQSIGADVVVTREPGGTAFGDRVRGIFIDPRARIEPLAEAFLMNASRAQLVVERIAPALKTGGVVILCDRFFDATVAYQGYGRGLDIEMLIRLSLVASQSIAPDITFLLDIDAATSHERVSVRGASDRLEREDEEFHERVRQGYLELAQRFNRIVVLDGRESPATLLTQALAIIARRRYAIAPISP